ncbi:patatin-like phospholipase [Diaporthe helianthi]|uniref:Patatin-like phospholipase n=1 Tax=Diaporthe helianthi TaxID=158607 RepID=A0A2P5HL30_DIAHE|nr:patatin-like phospholipase [Diaporthe helianthi]
MFQSGEGAEQKWGLDSQRFLEWYRHKAPTELWLDVLRHAELYEEWEEAALHLDNLLGLDLWRYNQVSRYYDYRLINERLDSLALAREDQDIHALVNLLRSGLVRNLGNITATKLYNRSFAGSKFLIEEYITQVAEAIEFISTLPAVPPSGVGLLGSNSSSGNIAGQTPLPTGQLQTQPSATPAVHFSSDNSSTTPGSNASNASNASNGAIAVIANIKAPMTMSNQMKLDFVHDTRQAFGRSTLVLQGGAIFGLCHLGVVKALFLRGLLPRIITGTATGALIAALVGIHKEEELPAVLKGDGIDLSAFATKNRAQSSGSSRWETLLRRVKRFWREGYFLDVKVLEQCVRANVGDLTFEEAYVRSKRVLNITVAATGQGGIPTLLNYLTAPNVLIWTAAVASNASTPTFYGHRETTILCKDQDGKIVPWAPANTIDFRHWTHVSYSDRDSPLMRIAELFNVNHFIVSQARPYLIPFLQSDMHGPSQHETRSKTTSITAFLVRMVGLEVRHRLSQLDTLGLLPTGIRRFLVDERIPGASVMLVPEVTAGDFIRLLETPTRETLDYWILRGERSVWPAVTALKIRCTIETELDRAYQMARRLKAGGLRRKSSISVNVTAGGTEKKHRANSVGSRN